MRVKGSGRSFVNPARTFRRHGRAVACTVAHTVSRAVGRTVSRAVGRTVERGSAAITPGVLADACSGGMDRAGTRRDAAVTPSGVAGVQYHPLR